MGERNAFRVQANRTLPGSSATSATNVQHADQGEQAPRRLGVEADLALERLCELFRALVVQAAPAHVDRLDTAGRGGADRLEIALADHEVIFDQPAKGPHRQRDLAAVRTVRVVDGEDQVRLAQRQFDLVGAAKAVHQLEGVALQQVEYRDLALVLDLAAPAHDAGRIEADADDPRGLGRAHSRPGPRRSATARAWPSRRSARASSAAAGPSARKASSGQASSVVRIRKS